MDVLVCCWQASLGLSLVMLVVWLVDCKTDWFVQEKDGDSEKKDTNFNYDIFLMSFNVCVCLFVEECLKLFLVTFCLYSSQSLSLWGVCMYLCVCVSARVELRPEFVVVAFWLCLCCITSIIFSTSTLVTGYSNRNQYANTVGMKADHTNAERKERHRERGRLTETNKKLFYI